MQRRHRKRSSSNSTFHHRLSRSRKSTHTDDNQLTNQLTFLNLNDNKERRSTSVSTMRSDSSLSFHQPLTLSQISLGETGQLQIGIEQKSRECVICVTEKFFKEFQGFYGDMCVHIERTVCNSCVYQNTKCLVLNSIIYFDDIACPEPNCQGIFDYQGIREILVVIGKDKTLFERYDEHLIYHQLEQMSDFLWCSYNCGSGQLIESEASSNPMVTCIKCNRPTCRKHRTMWHTDMTCDQYDLLQNQPTENDANQTWLKLFSKQCPNCHWNIQKTEGCDHMTCRYCKHEFCWECFVDYKLIANKGANHHQKSCSHYQV